MHAKTAEQLRSWSWLAVLLQSNDLGKKKGGGGAVNGIEKYYLITNIASDVKGGIRTRVGDFIFHVTYYTQMWGSAISRSQKEIAEFDRL